MIKHTLMAVAALAISAVGSSAACAASIKNIVIVHGAFADGSSWRAVSDLLTKDGYNVSIVQEPLTSFADDVAATNRVLSLQKGPTLLVGHSYGGMVITEAGKAKNVSGLVYVAAFAPDKGESVVKLFAKKPPLEMRRNAVLATPDGYLYMDPEAVHETFAADLPQADSDFIAHSQVFISQTAFSAEVSDPAWKTKPSYAIVATEDRSINPDLERDMALRAGSKTIEIKASHAVFASQPKQVAQFIAKAASGISQ